MTARPPQRLHVYQHNPSCPICNQPALNQPHPIHHDTGKYEGAKEGLLKLGDVAGLLALNVEAGRWDDAFLLLGGHAALKDQVYLPYAKWLLSQDRCVWNGGGVEWRDSCVWPAST